jgi:hypothetical protein
MLLSKPNALSFDNKVHGKIAATTVLEDDLVANSGHASVG